jgi:uncharacterized protein
VVLIGAACVSIAISVRLAEAASFPCNAPATARERLICGDAELTRADEALEVSYRSALATISELGRKALRNGQRDWVSYTDTMCAVGGNAPLDRPSALCLKDEYANRQRQLEQAVIKRGGIVIRRVDLFTVAPSSGSNPAFKFNTTFVSFPQIDQPRDEREEAWNKLVAEHSRSNEVKASDRPDTHDHEQLGR